MRVCGVVLALLTFGSWTSGSLLASGKAESTIPLNQVIQKLNHEAGLDVDSAARLMALIQREYATRDSELKWAAERSIPMGDVVALAHIQAATGRTFAELTAGNARLDFGEYAEKAGMNRDKMARSLENFLKEAQKARNTQIFERLRATRKISSMTDVGSGFGLLQESLDFSYISVSQPIKVNPVGGLKVGK